MECTEATWTTGTNPTGGDWLELRLWLLRLGLGFDQSLCDTLTDASCRPHTAPRPSANRIGSCSPCTFQGNPLTDTKLAKRLWLLHGNTCASLYLNAYWKSHNAMQQETVPLPS